MKQSLFLLLFLFASIRAQTQESKEHTVYFELDSYEISAEQNELLKSWIASFTDTIKKIEITGHTDFLGSKEYNMSLSQKRAEAVSSVLEHTANPHYRMGLIFAAGEEYSTPNGSKDGITADRKVEIKAFLLERTIPELEIEVAEDEPKETQQDSDLLEQASVGQTIVLKNLNFYPGRHFLVPQALPELERLIQIMKRNPTMEIEIQGHICCKLDSVDAMDVNTRTYSLSFNRAEYIFQQLALAGIKEKRMTYRGFAGSRPLIEPELTPEDRNRNRRVEIKILKK